MSEMSHSNGEGKKSSVADQSNHESGKKRYSGPSAKGEAEKNTRLGNRRTPMGLGGKSVISTT